MSALFQSIKKSDRVLVTGGTGTLGSALLPALLARTGFVRVLSRDEAKQDALSRIHPDVERRLGDVRDPVACRDAVRGVDIVIHAASLKYVDVSEVQPSEYALTNVNGTLNILDAVLQDGNVQQVIGISTDKACAPFNTYGLTKALLEKFFIEAHAYRRKDLGTLFTVCRYGNVIGSRGSVVLKWQELTAKGERIKVTDPEMTRFFFTIQDALRLIDQALSFYMGGVVVSQEMPSCTLGDLASLWGKFDVIGRRPGEKPHEDLFSEHEMPRMQRVTFGGERLFIYDPLVRPVAENLEPSYTSKTARRLTFDELDAMTQQWR